MFARSTFVLFTTFLLLGNAALAAHTINFQSNCPSAVMQLPGIGILGTGTYSYDHSVEGGIASAGPNCDLNGVPCIAVEFSLVDKYSTGDITLISPHVFTGTASFTMKPGGSSATCDNPNCGPNNAFYKPDDYTAQRYDPSPDAGIDITITC
ncbi:hypothetical protein A4X13_0g6320 [Tilletia indica]|uniref:Uncharacterized protein n=1 Tax=Tilletia indica TaxID=43049 RepID=A0A177TKU7_9BASI|nr:hypothetical protein A4X13_0g6320 [Tilletia indica]